MSETLNKKALAEIVTEELGMTEKDATVAVEIILDEIAKTLPEGGKVNISSFGKLEISRRPARMRISLATREPLEIAAPKASKFKAAKTLKGAVK